MFRLIIIFFSVLTAISSFSQTNISGIINTICEPAGAPTGTNSVFVPNSNLFQSGDTVLLIQMKGTQIDRTNTANYGNITSLNNAGNYEFLVVDYTDNAAFKVYFTCPLTRSYSGYCQLIKVPTYNNATVSGVLTAPSWNGGSGGVLVFMVKGTLTLNADIDVTGKGFRGATPDQDNLALCAMDDPALEGYYFSVNGYDSAGFKGEGIVVENNNYLRGRGKNANGGGGGHSLNAAGGGGGNYGLGGTGGKESDMCPVVKAVGGIGGIRLDNFLVTHDRLFLGGGGGAGLYETDMADVLPGGNGGGIIIILANTISGSATAIKANGSNVFGLTHIESAGGGGAGGSIALMVNNFTGNMMVHARGGKGGDATDGGYGCRGTGGGGGGGLIQHINILPGGVNTDVSAGPCGIDPTFYCDNTWHGTNGSAGFVDNSLLLTSTCLVWNSLANNTITSNQQICSGATPSFLSGSMPVGGTTVYSFMWQQSTDGGGTWQNCSAPNTNPGYTSGPLTATTLFRRIVTSGTETNISNIITITVYTVTSAISDKQDVSCPGLCDGSATVTAGGGNTYTYQWNTIPAQYSTTAGGLCPGTYTVTVTETLSGCTSVSSATIIPPALIQLSFIKTDVACYGGSTGAINLTVSGGTPSYEFIWSNSLVTEDISGLVAAVYSVTVTDNNGCTKTTSVTISQPTLLVLSATKTNVACPGGSGSIDLTVTGGSPGYFYLWSNTATTQDISGLSAGIYSVTVTDNSGCTKTLSDTITQPTGINLAAGHSDVTCFGGSDGWVNLTATGGVPPFTFIWSNSATTEDLAGVPAANYSVTATDDCGTTLTLSITVTEPPSPAFFDVTGGGSFCSGAPGVPVGLSGSSIGSSYQLLINGLNTGSPQNGNGLPLSFGNVITPGNYTVVSTITISGCTSTMIGNAVVIVNSLPSLYSVSGGGSYCQGGPGVPVGLTGSVSGTSYQLQCNAVNEGPPVNGNGGTLNFGLKTNPGAYTVIATIVSTGCTATMNGTASISVNALPVSFSITGGGAFCIGNTAPNIGLSGSQTGIMYQLFLNGSPDGLPVSGTGSALNFGNISIPGVYSVEATNSSTGCTETMTGNVSITANPVPGLSLTKTDITCNGADNGSASTSVTGGSAPYSYSWSDGNTLPGNSGMPPGNYSVTVTDNNGCSASQSFQLSEPPAISVTTSFTNPLCNGSSTGTISVAATGGTGLISYSIGNGQQTTGDFTLLASNAYVVSVTDANNCVLTVPFTLTDPPAITINSQSSVDPLCHNDTSGQIHMLASGGTGVLDYSIGGPGQSSGDFIQLMAGTYQVTISDFNGCTLTSNTFILDNPDSIVFSFTSTNLNCFGANDGAISVTASGGTHPFIFSISGQTQQTGSFSGLSSGSYIVTLTDANGCIATTPSIILTEPVSSTGTISSFIDTVCSGTTSSMNIILTGVPPWNIVYTDGINNFPVNNIITSPYTINILHSTSGIYSLSAMTDGNGCTVGSSFLSGAAAIVVQQKPLVDAGPDMQICGKTFTLNGTPSVLGHWSAPAGITFSSISDPFATGNVPEYLSYTFTWVIQEKFCTDSDYVVLSFFEAPDQPNAGEDQQLFQQVQALLAASPPVTGTGTWTVLSGEGICTSVNSPTTTVTNLSEGLNVFRWMVTNGNCPAVFDDIIISIQQLFIPSGFSPNGDLTNDYFVIKGIDQVIPNELIIFNRWGIEVFKAQNYNNDWNGMLSDGRPLPDETYFYLLRLQEKETLTGYIVIKR